MRYPSTASAAVVQMVDSILVFLAHSPLFLVFESVRAGKRMKLASLACYIRPTGPTRVGPVAHRACDRGGDDAPTRALALELR